MAVKPGPIVLLPRHLLFQAMPDTGWGACCCSDARTSLAAPQQGAVYKTRFQSWRSHARPLLIKSPPSAQSPLPGLLPSCTLICSSTPHDLWVLFMAQDGKSPSPTYQNIRVLENVNRLIWRIQTDSQNVFANPKSRLCNTTFKIKDKTQDKRFIIALQIWGLNVGKSKLPPSRRAFRVGEKPSISRCINCNMNHMPTNFYIAKQRKVILYDILLSYIEFGTNPKTAKKIRIP